MENVVKERVNADPLDELAVLLGADESFRMRQRISREQLGVHLEFAQVLHGLRRLDFKRASNKWLRSQVNQMLELLDDHDRLTQEREAI